MVHVQINLNEYISTMVHVQIQVDEYGNTINDRSVVFY